MIDKIQKIREEIENKLEVMQYQVHRKDAYKELKYVLDYIDSLQEESDYCCGDCAKWINGKGCSREKQNTHCITDAACEEGVKRSSKQKKPKFKVHDYIKPIDSSLGYPRIIMEICDGWYVTNQGTLDFEYEDNWELVKKPTDVDKYLYGKEPELVDEDDLPNKEEEPVSEDLEETNRNYAYGDDVYFAIKAAFKEVLSGRKKKDESTTEDLGKYINELSKQFPEVSFAKLSRIAVRAAKWQKEQIEEVLLSEVLPCFMHGGEADEVVAKLDEVLNQKK